MSSFTCRHCLFQCINDYESLEKKYYNNFHIKNYHTVLFYLFFITHVSHNL